MSAITDSLKKIFINVRLCYGRIKFFDSCENVKGRITVEIFRLDSSEGHIIYNIGLKVAQIFNATISP